MKHLVWIACLGLGCSSKGYQGYRPILGYFGTSSVEKGDTVFGIARGDRFVVSTMYNDLTDHFAVRFLAVSAHDPKITPEVDHVQPMPVDNGAWEKVAADGAWYVAIAHRRLKVWHSPALGDIPDAYWPESLGEWAFGSIDYGDFIALQLRGSILWVLERSPENTSGVDESTQFPGWLHRIDLFPLLRGEAPIWQSANLPYEPTGLAVTDDRVWVSTMNIAMLTFNLEGEPSDPVVVGTPQKTVVGNQDRVWVYDFTSNLISFTTGDDGKPENIGQTDSVDWRSTGDDDHIAPDLLYADPSDVLFFGGAGYFTVVDGAKPKAARVQTWLGPQNDRLNESSFEAVWHAYDVDSAGRSLYLAAGEGGAMLWAP